MVWSCTKIKMCLCVLHLDTPYQIWIIDETFRFKILHIGLIKYKLPMFDTTEAVTKLHAPRSRKDSKTTPLTPYRAALSHQYSVASFATLRVLSYDYLTGLQCSCCNVVWFCCGLEAYNLVTAGIIRTCIRNVLYRIDHSWGLAILNTVLVIWLSLSARMPE
jgi:hypothetical protein